MPVFQISLTGFHFPRELPNNQANFRFVVDLRYVDDQGQFATKHAVMPSLDTFWECDESRLGKPNYVRGADVGEGPARLSTFDMNRIDDWDKLVLLVTGRSLHSIQFKVYDVDRRDAWDSVKDFLRGILEALVGRLKDAIPTDLPAGLSGSLGSAGEDIQSFLLKKLAGGDNVLFRGSSAFRVGDADDLQAQPHQVEGHGTKGTYSIGFHLGARGDATIVEAEEQREHQEREGHHG